MTSGSAKRNRFDTCRRVRVRGSEAKRKRIPMRASRRVKNPVDFRTGTGRNLTRYVPMKSHYTYLII